MNKHNAVAFPHPQASAADSLTEVLRQGTKRLLAQAIKVEVATWLACDADERDDQGRQAVVRNGCLPEREVRTSIGAILVQVPRIGDRSGQGMRFTLRFCRPIGGAHAALKRYGHGCI